MPVCRLLRIAVGAEGLPVTGRLGDFAVEVFFAGAFLGAGFGAGVNIRTGGFIEATFLMLAVFLAVTFFCELFAMGTLFLTAVLPVRTFSMGLFYRFFGAAFFGKDFFGATLAAGCFLTVFLMDEAFVDVTFFEVAFVSMLFFAAFF